MKKILQNYINYGLAQKADELEIFCLKSKGDSVTVRQQQIEKIEAAEDRGLSVRVIKNKQFGFSYTTSLEEADILKTIDSAIANSCFTAKDKFLKLPKLQKQKTKKNLRIFDETLEKLSPQKKIELAMQTEKAAYALDPRIKKTESSGFSSTLARSWLINSKGIYQEEQNTACGVSLEVIAEDNDQMEGAYDYQYVTHYQDLNPEQVGRNAAQKAILMLGSGSALTGKYDLLLPPKTAVDFLSILGPMFSADNIQKNMSLLKNKLHKSIAGSHVTLLDDPFMVKGLGSYLYDAEGVPAKAKALIKNGVLNSYLYDTYTAHKAGLKSTGNASRHSIKAEPQIGTGNVYLKPGTKKPAAIIKTITKGIIINNIMGLHTADTISGEFSLGASGQLIESGKITRSVKDIAIAGNLIDFLRSIHTIGSDLTFNGAIGSPSVLVKDIMVAGK